MTEPTDQIERLERKWNFLRCVPDMEFMREVMRINAEYSMVIKNGLVE
jgi:hypothetical protein